MRGSINQNKDTKKWDFAVTLGRDPVTGKRKQITRRGFPTKKAAERELTKLIAEYERGSHIDLSKLTLATYLTDRWLPARKAKLRATTYARYESIINVHLVPGLGAIPIQKLRPEALQAWYAKLGKRLSPKSVANIHGVLHKALNDALKWGLVGRNVADLVELSKGSSPAQEVWSPAQLKTFLASVATDRLAAAWRLLAATGLRRGEIIGLRWSDVDLDTATIRIAETLVMVNSEVAKSAPKTEKGKRTLSIDPVTLAALKTWRATQAAERLAVGPRYVDSGRVFTLPDGSPLNPHRFSIWFGQRARAAGLPVIRLHDVRHSYATAGLAAGVPLKIMSARLGHANTAITADLYQHVLPSMDAAAADQVAAIIDG
jgi:integrase